MKADTWEVRRNRILRRAGYKCEECGAKDGQPHPVTRLPVALTVIHLQDTKDDQDENLKALCQSCRAQHTARMRRKRELAAGQMELGAEE